MANGGGCKRSQQASLSHDWHSPAAMDGGKGKTLFSITVDRNIADPALNRLQRRPQRKLLRTPEKQRSSANIGNGSGSKGYCPASPSLYEKGEFGDRTKNQKKRPCSLKSFGEAVMMMTKR